MAGLNVQGKFGAPPASPEEEATFASEWNNFFTKLKTDPTMQQAMLSFAAQVSDPGYGGNAVHAIADSANSALGGYRATKAAQAQGAIKEKRTQEKHDADTGKTRQEIVESAVQAALLKAQAGKETAQAERTAGGVDLDRSQAELNRARASKAGREAEAVGTDKSKLTNQDKIAQALMSKDPSLSAADAYLQAEQIAKSPSQTKIIMDFVNSQGFLYGDDLPKKVEEVVGLAGGMQPPAATTPVGATPGINPTLGVQEPAVDLKQLRIMADAYAMKSGASPISEAKLIQLSKSPTAIMQLKSALGTGAPNGQ